MGSGSERAGSFKQCLDIFHSPIIYEELPIPLETVLVYVEK